MNLLERFQNGLMPSPAGLGGLLSPEDLSSARRRGLLDIGLNMMAGSRGAPGQDAPGFLPTLANSLAAGRQGFEQSATGTVQGRLQSMELGQKMHDLETRQKLVAKLQQQFPDFAKMNEAQQNTALRSVFGELLTSGNFDAAGKMASVIPALTKTPAFALPFKDVDRGGKIERHHNDGRVEIIDKYPSAKDPNAPDTAVQMREQRQFQKEQQLTDDFNKDTKTYRELGLKIQNAVSVLPDALAGNGAAQTNMLYAFVSAMDPASAVREGEIGLVQAAAGLRDRAMQLIQKAGGNSAAVPPDMLKMMAGLMQRRLHSTSDYIGERQSYYSNLAKRYNIGNPSQLFPGMNVRDPSTAPPTGGASSNPLLSGSPK